MFGDNVGQFARKDSSKSHLSCEVGERIDSNTWKFYSSIQNFNRQIQRQGRRSWRSQTHQEDYRANLTVNAEISPSLLKIPCSFIYLFILLQRSFIDLIQRRVHSLGKKLNWRELITLPDPILICLVRGFTWADLRNRTWQKNLFDISLFIVEYPNSGVFF